MFPTIKAAMEAGYRERKTWEYGGKETEVKGHLLVMDPKRAMSASEWAENGFRVPADTEPHDTRFTRAHGKGMDYAVYREDQVEPKRKVLSAPAMAVDILAAVWILNRRAKRCRDSAQSYYRAKMHGFAGKQKGEKDTIYANKGQALHNLLNEGRLVVTGYHRFSGGNWAEVLSGGGYTFHRPCPERTDDVKEIGQIDAKPRGAREPRLLDARYTVEQYLAGKPRVHVFEWEPKANEHHRASDHDGGCDVEDEDDDYDDYDYPVVKP